MSESLEPARLVPPGRILERELEARDWTQRDLAAVMGRPPQAINEIIRGTKQITPETAIELGNALGTSAEFWTELEYQYRLGLARKERRGDDDQITRRSRLYSLAPVNELIKRGWLRATESLDELERDLCRFLKITSIEQTPLLEGPFRASGERGPEYGATVAWVRRVEQLASLQEVAPFDIERLQRAIPDLRALAKEPEQIAKVPKLLRESGVRFVHVRHLPRTYIDGVMCIVEGQPVIGLSLRYDRIDSFWFTLMHECAHLVLGHECPPVDNLEDKEALSGGIEAEADQQARRWLLDQPSLQHWVKRTNPYFGRAAIERFADNQELHPGVVLGQLMFDGTVTYKHLRMLLVRVSPFLSDWMEPTL